MEDEEAADAVVDERVEDRVMDKSVDEDNTDQTGMDDEEATDAVVDERVEDRVMGSKIMKMGDKMDAVDSRLDRRLPVGEVSPAHIPQSRDQDKRRLQMLLERALAERTNQAISIEDPKDRRYKHLLEEMQADRLCQYKRF